MLTIVGDRVCWLSRSPDRTKCLWAGSPGVRRAKVLLVGVLLALGAVLFAALTVGYGLPPVEAGMAVAGVAVLGLVEVVLNESSV